LQEVFVLALVDLVGNDLESEESADEDDEDDADDQNNFADAAF